MIFLGGSSIKTGSVFRILGRSDFPDPYRQKYKGIACALDMFSNALSGGYTNFGVFEVYNDNVLANSLALGLQLCLAIPDEGKQKHDFIISIFLFLNFFLSLRTLFCCSTDLQAYIKALKPFYHFLELTALSFMDHVSGIT